jgi:uncharacterized protein YdeI (YjbR/CyaY-like superfamily)
MPGSPKSFRTSEAFRAWLEKNHANVAELNMRLYKVHARAKGIGYREALDEALCFGWIDGVRRSHDGDSVTQRFTPRKAKSNWSDVNIARAKELIAEGRMHPAGRAAFEKRDTSATAPYSYLRDEAALAPAFLRRLKADPRAWAHWQALAPYYRRVSTFWVMSAKRDDTRERRFAELLDKVSEGRKIGLLEPKKR